MVFYFYLKEMELQFILELNRDSILNEISTENISNLNKDMISSALEICEKNQADALFLYADAIDNFEFFEELPSGFKIFFTTSSTDTFNQLVEKKFLFKKDKNSSPTTK